MAALRPKTEPFLLGNSDSGELSLCTTGRFSARIKSYSI